MGHLDAGGHADGCAVQAGDQQVVAVVGEEAFGGGGIGRVVEQVRGGVHVRRVGDAADVHRCTPSRSRARADLEARSKSLFDIVKSGKVKIEISARYKLAEAAKCHTDLEGRRTTGSVILLP